MENPGEAAPPDTTALMSVARGFSCAFWGLALTVLVLSGVLAFTPVWLIHVPGHAAGVLLLVFSVLWFWRSRRLSPRWNRRILQYAGAAALQVYLLPFFGWWRTIDHNLYYLANLALAIGSTLWLILLLHLMVVELARCLGDPVLRVEAQIGLWITPLLAGISLGLFAFGAVWIAGIDHEGMVRVIRGIVSIQTPWRHLPAALPFLLALAVTWEAKERCLFAIAQATVNAKRT